MSDEFNKEQKDPAELDSSDLEQVTGGAASLNLSELDIVKKKAAAASANSKAKPKQKFNVSHFRAEDFKADGLRSYAKYRDLGMSKATSGLLQAHVIRLLSPCDPKVVSKDHLHEADFQMIYVLKGTITTEIKGQGVHTMHAGDCWLQPRSAVHKVLDYSEGCEVLEIVMPANFKTVELEK